MHCVDCNNVNCRKNGNDRIHLKDDVSDGRDLICGDCSLQCDEFLKYYVYMSGAYPFAVSTYI